MSEMHTINVLDRSPFKHLVCTIGNLPTSFVDSMSYYEALAWLVNYIEKTLIPAINDDAEAITELQESFLELQQYVEDYFSDLNVQEQINNKLDEMAEGGELADIINQEIFGEINDHLDVIDGEIDGLEELINGKIEVYNTVALMKASDTVANGSIVKTVGFHNADDKGGAYYRIRTKGESEVANNMSTFDITSDNTLIAELILQGTEGNPKQFGAALDGLTDDTAVVKFCLETYGAVKFPAKSTVFLDNLRLGNFDCIDFNNSHVYSSGNAIQASRKTATSHSQNIVIKNGRFVCETAGTSEERIHVIDIYNTIRGKIENCVIYYVRDYVTGIYIENSFNIDMEDIYIGNSNGEKSSGSNGIQIVADTPSGSNTNNLTNINVSNALIQYVGNAIAIVPTDGSIDTCVFDNIGVSQCSYGLNNGGSTSSAKNIMLSNSRVEHTTTAIGNRGQLTIMNIDINKPATYGIRNYENAYLTALGFIQYISNGVDFVGLRNEAGALCDFSSCQVAADGHCKTQLYNPIMKHRRFYSSAHTGTDFSSLVSDFEDYIFRQSDAFATSDLPPASAGTHWTILYNGKTYECWCWSNTWYVNTN